jgi:hypothetical protein
MTEFEGTKEKAEGLVDKMYYARRYKDAEDYIPLEAWEHAKQCALIAVDELIKSWDKDLYENCGTSEYWQEVKQELLKL